MSYSSLIAVALSIIGANCCAVPLEANAAEARRSPVAAIRISEQWLRSEIAKQVDRWGDVDKVVLGTPVRGTSRTSGVITLDVLPGDESARIRVFFVGRTLIKSRGYERPVVIDTTSWTDFHCTSELYLDAKGFHSTPARIAARTGSNTDRVISNRNGLLDRAVRRVAWRRVNSTRPQTEAITLQDTASEVRSSFDTVLRDRLRTMNRRIGFSNLMLETVADAGYDKHHVSSTEDAILISFGGQPGAAPNLASLRGAPGVQLYIHDSALGSAATIAMQAIDVVGRDVLIATPSEPAPGAPVRLNILSRLADRWTPIKELEREAGWTILQLRESTASETRSRDMSD